MKLARFTMYYLDKLINTDRIKDVLVKTPVFLSEIVGAIAVWLILGELLNKISMFSHMYVSKAPSILKDILTPAVMLMIIVASISAVVLSVGILILIWFLSYIALDKINKLVKTYKEFK